MVTVFVCKSANALRMTNTHLIKRQSNWCGEHLIQLLNPKWYYRPSFCCQNIYMYSKCLYWIECQLWTEQVASFVKLNIKKNTHIRNSVSIHNFLLDGYLVEIYISYGRINCSIFVRRKFACRVCGMKKKVNSYRNEKKNRRSKKNKNPEI